MNAYKVDFHNHCSCDPIDLLFYSPRDLVDKAVECGLNAISITPHGSVFADSEVIQYAKSKGLLLISGIEKRIEGKELLLLNVRPDEIPQRMTFEDLRNLRARKGADLFVIAPHPFYPTSACLAERMDEVADCIDGVELAHFFFSEWNPNIQAIEWARKNNRPLLANSDSHALFMPGRSYTTVMAPQLTYRDVFDALRKGLSTPHLHIPSLFEVVRFVIGVTIPQDIIRRIHPAIRQRVLLNG